MMHSQKTMFYFVFIVPLLLCCGHSFDKNTWCVSKKILYTSRGRYTTSRYSRRFVRFCAYLRMRLYVDWKQIRSLFIRLKISVVYFQ